VNITFTGPQCSGKTTLLKAMRYGGGVFDKFFYINEVTRKIRDECNIPINEEGANDITQLLIINEELKNLFTCGSMGDWCRGVVHDRCLLDGLVYTEYFYDKKLVGQAVYNQALQYWHRFYDRYDIIFYPSPHDVQLEDDGERSTDAEFRNAIIEKYENYYLNQFQWKEKIIILKGTVEQRMEQIKIKLHEQGIR
jgi:hypothetical protein